MFAVSLHDKKEQVSICQVYSICLMCVCVHVVIVHSMTLFSLYVY